MLRNLFFKYRGLPFKFRNLDTLPKIQKDYKELDFDPKYEATEQQELEDLYKIYVHALITSKPFILRNFVEERFFYRIKSFCDQLQQNNIKIIPTLEIESDSCNLTPRVFNFKKVSKRRNQKNSRKHLQRNRT